jgi:hypothetical protein
MKRRGGSAKAHSVSTSPRCPPFASALPPTRARHDAQATQSGGLLSGRAPGTARVAHVTSPVLISVRRHGDGGKNRLRAGAAEHNDLPHRQGPRQARGTQARGGVLPRGGSARGHARLPCVQMLGADAACLAPPDPASHSQLVKIHDPKLITVHQARGGTARGASLCAGPPLHSPC